MSQKAEVGQQGYGRGQVGLALCTTEGPVSCSGQWECRGREGVGLGDLALHAAEVLVSHGGCLEGESSRCLLLHATDGPVSRGSQLEGKRAEVSGLEGLSLHTGDSPVTHGPWPRLYFLKKF